MAEAFRILMPGKVHAYAGYVFGMRQPCIAISIALTVDLASMGQQLQQVWQTATALQDETGLPAPGSHWESLPDGLEKLALWILHWVDQIQRSENQPIHENGRILDLKQNAQAAGASLLLPSSNDGAQLTINVLSGVLEMFEASFLAESIEASIDGARARTNALKDSLHRYAPTSSNTPWFLKAAFEQGIPVDGMGNHVYQFGQGKRSYWLESTTTENTSSISVRMARNKYWAASVLRKAGIPVPNHFLVSSCNEAVTMAESLGYPVVIKPVDEDGGKGVHAGLLHANDVYQAYGLARQFSPNILVEKHVQGRDFRLTVFNGKLIWAIERIPAGVTGDGASTIAQLIDAENRNPQRGNGKHSALKKICIDHEASALLAQQNLSFGSVPQAGCFVRLKQLANVSAGGVPVAVNESVHPDNAALAIRATEALRLDIAGVDLLISDISKSWKEIGAVVCEVNSQPQIGIPTAPHLYGAILRVLTEGNGRIPNVVLLCDPSDDILPDALFSSLEEKGLRVGMYRRGETSIAGELRSINSSPVDSWAIMNLDKKMDASIFCLGDQQVLSSGLPFERIDILVLADSQGKKQNREWLHLLMMSEPACDGCVIASRNNPFTLSHGRIIELPESIEDQVSLITDEIETADQHHKNTL